MPKVVNQMRLKSTYHKIKNNYFSIRNNINPLRRSVHQIFGLAKSFKRRFYLATAAKVLASIISLIIPLGLKKLVDAVFVRSDYELLRYIALGMFILFFIQAALKFYGTYNLGWVGVRAIANLRSKLYKHLHSLDLEFYTNQKIGELTSRLTNDVNHIKIVLTATFPSLFTVGFSLFGSIILMILLNWVLSLIILFTIPVIMIGAHFFGKKIRAISKSIQDDLAETTAIAEETLFNISVVKEFARELYEVKRYRSSVEEVFKSSKRKVLISALFISLVSLLFMTTLVLIFWFGGKEVLNNRLSAGDLVAFVFYAFTLASSTRQVSNLYSSLNSASGACERLFGLLEIKPRLKNKRNPISLNQINGRITFDEVSFGYQQNNHVLNNISFEIKPGSTVAVVGLSGAGKTTLLRLIPRFYDVTSGCIKIDGHNVKSIYKKELRKQIGIVSQEIQLFGDTVYDNIKYGKLNAKHEEVIYAAKNANAYEFISNLPEKFLTNIGEKGIKLSRGQRQRISIARALLKNPKILLLDEATSSLDPESESSVQKALKKLLINRTTIISAHRFSTIMHVDKILVLKDGCLIQKGLPKELINKEGLFRHLYYKQFEEEDHSTLSR